MIRKACIIFYLFGSAISAQDTLTYSKMNNEQFRAWDEVESNWKKEHFQPFLKKEKIKLDCGKCTSVYVSVIFRRDSVKTSYELMKTWKCDDEMKGRQLYEMKKILGEIKLPELFDNYYLKVMLGSRLKC